MENPIDWGCPWENFTFSPNPEVGNRSESLDAILEMGVDKTVVSAYITFY